MEKVIKCKIHFKWDDEAMVWIATSKDVPGLVLESGSLDCLMERVRYAVPELLELNHKEPEVIDYSFISFKNDKVAVYG